MSEIFTDTVHGEVAKLIALTRNWNAHEDIPRSQQLECAEIGKRLYVAGGMKAMQDAYYQAKNANRYVSIIQAYWHGIGDWQW